VSRLHSKNLTQRVINLPPGNFSKNLLVTFHFNHLIADPFLLSLRCFDLPLLKQRSVALIRLVVLQSYRLHLHDLYSFSLFTLCLSVIFDYPYFQLSHPASQIAFAILRAY
jgi:hypothetical protein